jgi:hypothetical protein
MTATKTTGLGTLTSVDGAADFLPIVDVSDVSMAASGTTKKVLPNNLPISTAMQAALDLKAALISPFLVTPNLGTPSAGTLTNATGLPISTGVSGLGTGVATFLATPSSANLASAVTDETGTGALVFATSPILVTPALGTPSSGVLTSCTGLPISTGVSGLGTGVATFLATPSSANLRTAVTDETGSGLLVFATSPTLVTPVLGVASATSINKVAFTAPATGSTLVIADGKTFTASNSLALAGTDGSTLNVGTGGTLGTAAYTAATAYATAIHAHAGADITSGTVDPARLGSGASISTKFLRGDSTWQTISGGGDALTSGNLSQFAATTSAQLAGVISDETGSGALVFATSPVLVTPALGTPSSGVLTSCTGLPVSTGISGLAAGVATFLATPSSANFATVVTDETGSGALVFATSPTLVTPALGTPSSGNLANCTFPTLNQNTTGSAALNVLKAGDTMTGLLQFSGTTHAGLRLINLTTTERDAIASPAAGMLIWNTTTIRLNRYNGSAWSAGFVAVNGDTMTGALTTVAAASGQESLIITPGSAPSSPTNGSMWITSVGQFTRIGGVTHRTGGATRSIRLQIDGSGSTIATGLQKAMLTVPFDCVITGWRILSDVSGSIVIDIWKDTYANFPPTIADTIVASAKPTLSAARSAESTTLTGWITSISAGDVLFFNVDSASTVTFIELSLNFRMT